MGRIVHSRFLLALIIGATALLPNVLSAASKGHHKHGARTAHARKENGAHRAGKQRKASAPRQTDQREIERRWDEERIEPPLPEDE